MIAHLISDRFDFAVPVNQQFGGPTHADPNQLLTRAAAQLTLTESLQMLFAQVNHFGHPRNRPRRTGGGRDLFPQLPQPGIVAGGFCEAQNVVMNQIHPTVDGTGVVAGARFAVQSQNGQPQRFGVVASDDGRSCSRERLASFALLVSDPAEIPRSIRRRLKRLQRPRRQQHRVPGATFGPAAVDQNASFAPKAGQKVTSPQFCPDNLERRRHPSDRKMSDLMMHQVRANRCFGQPGSRISGIGPYHGQFGIRRPNVGFR